MTPRIEAATRDGRATSPTMWPTSCGSAAPSVERVPDLLLDFLEAHDTGRPVQLPVPMAI